MTFLSFRLIKDELIKSPLQQDIQDDNLFSSRIREGFLPAKLSKVPIFTFGPNNLALPLNIQIRLCFEGSHIRAIEPEIGFFHQGIEKLLPTLSIPESLKALARLNPENEAPLVLAFIMALEKKLHIEKSIPEGTEIARVIILEASRIKHHSDVLVKTLALTSSNTVQRLSEDYRKKATALYKICTRTHTNALQHQISTLTEPFAAILIQQISFTAEEMLAAISDLQEAILEDSSARRTMQNIGRLSLSTALNHGITGPTLRACGRSFDLRHHAPYLSYTKFTPSIATRKEGDLWARTLVRQYEIESSLKFIIVACSNLKKESIGEPLNHAIPDKFVPGIHHMSIEAPEGELVVSLCSIETALTRVRIKTPSFTLVSALPAFLKNADLNDMALILTSLGIHELEADR